MTTSREILSDKMNDFFSLLLCRVSAVVVAVVVSSIGSSGRSWLFRVALGEPEFKDWRVDQSCKLTTGWIP